MLSILIPVYNYPISNLIGALDRVTKELNFPYEILCLEDGSQSFVDENKAVCNKSKHTFHIISHTNKGRITSRKHLATKANYSWLIFLDADVELSNAKFITDYSVFFSDNFEAVYGGCSYDIQRPQTSQMLRWKYGKMYEEIDAKLRNKKPYKHIVSANFLIKKDVFKHLISKIDKEGYGYDLFLGALMKQENIKVHHINNMVIHKGLEESSVFLNKVELAVETNYKLLSEQKINTAENSLLETYKSVKTYGLINIIDKIYGWLKKPIKRQLLGGHPSIKLLQFYKLGYLCALSLKKE